MKSKKKCEEFPQLDILINHFITLLIKETHDELGYDKKLNNENNNKNLKMKSKTL